MTQWLCELAKLPSLQKLVCDVRPEGVSVSKYQRRGTIIAKIPQLRVLQGTDISNVERNSAEIHFLEEFGRCPIAEENRADVERLRKLHNYLSSSRTNEYGVRKLKLSHNGKTVERLIPGTITVQNLSTIMRKIFGLGTKE
ncbi:unnamed protein product, partial [Gongylonema pulchrum]|uniref:Uncharacterized protein n=1 Tax=Gongylonema pulchrum TaxID=637853 RepID=A0A183EXG5_9BILA